MVEHRNNIGFIRLVLATLVIVTHTTELYNPFSEPFIAIFGSRSIGFLAVSLFFIISGWLIAKSWERSGTMDYLRKRILRIYPAFLLAWLFTILVSTNTVGITGVEYWKMFFLAPTPTMIDKTASNASLWTIGYEFRCYLFVMIVGLLGMFRDRRIVLVLTGFLVVGYFISHIPSLYWHFDGFNRGRIHWFWGSWGWSLRLLSNFMIGVCAYHYRDRLGWIDGRVALATAILAVLCLFDRQTAEIGAMSFGSIALFWLVFNANLGVFQKINDRWDISYGTYLYAWPIQTLTHYWWPNMHIVPFIALNIVLSWIVGYLSWKLVEEKVLAFK